MDMATLLVIIGVVLVVIGVVIFAMATQYRKVGPNEVLIVSGGRRRTVTESDGSKRTVGYRLHIGGGTFVMPFIETAQALPLETYTINLKTPEVLTRQGVHIIAEAAAQVKVASSEKSIRLAAEQFLGRGAAGIKEVSEHILEGYVRSLLGRKTIEEIYQNRDEFASTLRKEAEDDMSQMGLALLSFNLKDLTDSQGYLDALGQPRIAQVKRDAAIAKAEAEKETTIQAAQARKEGDIVHFQVETEIASARRDYEERRAEYQIEINKRRAQAEAAYDLERHNLAAELKKAEYQVRLVEKESSIKVEKQEILRRELELESSVKKPATARKFQIEAEADAEKYRIAAEAQGHAEARRVEGEAEISVKQKEGASRIEYTRAMGRAEAEAMSAKAKAFKDYNEAAVAQMFVEKMPEIARAVTDPLKQIDKITLISSDGTTGASRITGQVGEILSQLPTVIKSLSGIDVTKFFGQYKGAEDTDKRDEE